MLANRVDKKHSWSMDLAFLVQADKELREMNEQMIAEKDMKLRHMKAGDRKRPVAVSETTFMIFYVVHSVYSIQA